MPDIFIEKESNEKPTSKKEVKKNIAETPVNKGQAVSTAALKTNKKRFYSHFFDAYYENPPKVSFSDLLPNEELLLFLRRHFITNVPWIINAILLALVPPILSIASRFITLPLDFLPREDTILIVIFYYFLVAGYIFINYLTWFYNISLVTTARIIDIDFSSLVFENVAATKLTQVEDVSYSQIGVIRSIFDYGDVLVQTAGTTDEFEFLAVPHPEKVINVINNLIGPKHA